ncbi:hypothetical protein O1611_g671 [Lasiodiplodia mahajangana]|uniref:Uncharacterized protein n=1 Tax=Lasiodiplodia mahajangana TaxID=1108764 RepID=A0ACC2JZV1_9PEZI|nr:hypothetical protein O1611_g671 [Lasiodiplodia mahajangana]
MSAYEHQPLALPNSTRVVIVEPSNSLEAPIECSLEEVDLDGIASPSGYEALSYVWGERVGTIPIICHGKPLLVTPNCHHALIHLRLSSERRRMFIDAICIDQRSGESSQRERENQVASMGQVYEKALRVVIWLGTPHPATKRLFKILRMVQLAHDWQDHSTKLEEAFLHLIRNPWFSRVVPSEISLSLPLISLNCWTLQEQLLADQMNCVAVCGEHRVEYEAIERGITPLFKIWQGPKALPDLSPDERQLALRGLLDPIGTWLLIQDLDSMVPHDKIFALYGIFTRYGLNLPRPDYSKPVSEIFEAATVGILQQTNSLGILTLCTREACVTEGLPSWVPDWAIKSSPNQDTIKDKFLVDREYAATRCTGVVSSKAIGGGKLVVRGIIVGRISFLSVSPTIASDGEHLSKAPYGGFSKACQAWCQRVALSSTYCTGCPTLEAVKRTLLLTPDRHKDIPVLKESRKDAFESFSECFDLMLYPNCRIHDPEVVKARLVEHMASCMNVASEIDGAAEPIINDLGTVLISYMLYVGERKEPLNPVLCIRWANYALMILDTGHIARGARVCKEGDVVALLAGYEVPVALRSDGNGHYKFVAPLYVDGIMHGEAWPENESTLEEITLV